MADFVKANLQYSEGTYIYLLTQEEYINEWLANPDEDLCTFLDRWFSYDSDLLPENSKLEKEAIARGKERSFVPSAEQKYLNYCKEHNVNIISVISGIGY